MTEQASRLTSTWAWASKWGPKESEKIDWLRSLTSGACLSMLSGMPSVDREATLKQMACQPSPPVRAKASLHEFVKQAWHIIEPDTPFKDGWHIRVVCAHFESIVWGSIPKIVVNVPPGTMKSILSSVCLCPWAWLTNPSMRFMHASYSQTLALRDSVKARQIVRSPWYKDTCRQLGLSVELLRGQDQKSRFDTTDAGWRFATSVGGSATGEHPDVICVDDVHSAEQAESEKERESAVNWWQGTMTTRGRSRGARRAIVGQRLHEDDLPGVLIREGWERLVLPMRYEREQHAHTSLGDCDMRSNEGDLLCPTLFGERAVTELETELGSHRAAGQLQQRPTALAGDMFRREWFTKSVPSIPGKGRWVRYWDKAGTADAGAYTAGVLMGYRDGMFYVADVVRGQWSSHQRNEVIDRTTAMDAKRFADFEVWVEQEPGSGGKESAEITQQRLAGFRVKVERVTGDKVTRALNYAAQCEAGNVVLVEGVWNREFIDEHTQFPNGKYKDQVDGGSGAFNKLAVYKGSVAKQLDYESKATLELPEIDFMAL